MYQVQLPGTTTTVAVDPFQTYSICNTLTDCSSVIPILLKVCAVCGVVFRGRNYNSVQRAKGLSPQILFLFAKVSRPKTRMAEASSVSEISDELPFEVTCEDYIQRLSVGQRPPLQRGVADRLSYLMNRSRRARAESNGPCPENEVRSHEDIQSLSYTVASNDTVKASNRSSKGERCGFKKKGSWNRIKRMIGVKTAPADSETIGQSFSFPSSDDYSTTAKCSTLKRQNVAAKRVRSCPQSGLVDQEMLDHTIVSRLDGIDLIPLHSSRLVSKVLHPKFPQPDSASLHCPSFAGLSFVASPADLIARALEASGGRNHPEIVLDGFLPGCDDRWTVQVERVSTGRHSGWTAHIGNQRAASNLSHPQQLRSTLWGTEIPPTNLTDVEKVDAAEDPVLLLAAECSVPIDVDEDTFIVSSRDHLMAIHEIAATPLSRGNFTLALQVFFKLLKGLDLVSDYPFLKGTVLHNIGMIELWQGEYKKALSSFTRAVEERIRHLPKNHPDTVVSMARKGMTLFALERLNEATTTFETAMALVPREHLTKAKLRNNLGVLYYHKGSFAASLKEFTKSLEIQRTWLESSIRRESLVYDAATTLSNMGCVYMERRDHDLACHVYEEALLLQTTIFRHDTDFVLESMSNLAYAVARNGNVQRAIQILQSCLRLTKGRFGSSYPDSIEITGLVGFLQVKAQNYQEAMKSLSTVRKWQKANLPPSDPCCQHAIGIIELVEEKLESRTSVWV